MTYTVKSESKIRLSKSSNWLTPYEVCEFVLDNSLCNIDRFIDMHILNGYRKNILKDGKITLYKQVANNECELITITENK